MNTKRKLTEDERIRRAAARKAERRNEAARRDAGPLYADQIPAAELTDAAAEYWKARQSWALCQRGHEAAYLAGVDAKVDLWIIRNLARRIMPAEDFKLACDCENRFGSVIDFWRNILLGRRRIVLEWHRQSFGWRPFFREEKSVCCEHGCRQCESAIITYAEKATIEEASVWPPQGYKAPLTAEQLEAYLALPMPIDFPGAVDPLGLA